MAMDPALAQLELAVVGHMEWVSFVAVEQLPVAGVVQHARAFREEPAGAGAVAAVQLARLTGRRVRFFTALGRDATGEQAAARLEQLGLELHVAWRQAPSRRGVSFVDGAGERSITVIGERLGPVAADPLPWQELADSYGCGDSFAAGVTAGLAAGWSAAAAIALGAHCGAACAELFGPYAPP